MTFLESSTGLAEYVSSGVAQLFPAPTSRPRVRLAEYVSSGFAQPPASIMRGSGASPLGSEHDAAFVAALTADIDRAERRLLAWFRMTDAESDDFSDPPSRAAIWGAITFTQRLKETLEDPHQRRDLLPIRAVTVGSGGAISVECERGAVALTYTFEPDGSAECLRFESGKLRSRSFTSGRAGSPRLG